jgi:hypothetical protein
VAAPLSGRVLGGARVIALDLLWLRAELRRQQGYTLELPALYRTIAALDPANPRVWEFHADVLLANLPLASAGEADGGWRFAREGLELLLDGRRANPDNERLAFTLAYHLAETVSDRRPAIWRTRVAETFGKDPLQWADALLRQFHRRPDHTGRTDALLAIVLDRRAAEAQGAEAAALRSEADRLRTHLRTAHGMDLQPERPLQDHDR